MRRRRKREAAQVQEAQEDVAEAEAEAEEAEGQQWDALGWGSLTTHTGGDTVAVARRQRGHADMRQRQTGSGGGNRGDKGRDRRVRTSSKQE
jgi:hypothetical protein